MERNRNGCGTLQAYNILEYEDTAQNAEAFRPMEREGMCPLGACLAGV
jgi:hypothetical protein